MLSYRYATSPDSSHTGYSTTKVAAQQGYERADGALTPRIPFRYGGGRLQRLRTTTHQRIRWSEPVWSPPPESNRRPHPYHGCALPTELGGQVETFALVVSLLLSLL